MSLRVFLLLSLLVSISAVQAQTHWSTPRYTKTFTPAEHTLFADDLSAYTKAPPATKWLNIARSVTAADYADHAPIYPYVSIERPLTPVITTQRPNARYITFECDFLLLLPNASQFTINFPDARGYEHEIGVDDHWIHEKWHGEHSGGLDIITPIRKNKRTDPFDPRQWHCLGISISAEYINVFIDNRQVWSIGHDSLSMGNGAYVFDGYYPASFTISSRSVVGFRYVRLAQSDEIPKDDHAEIRTFDSLLTGHTFVTHDILFETGKANIKGGSTEYLASLAQWLQQNQKIRLEICGHTDNVGKEADNLLLSRNRATAVVNYLIAAGIDTGRLTSTGYGATRPLRPNETEAGRSANRRVELRKL